MSTINDGGSAFPVTRVWDDRLGCWDDAATLGMSLRDYFAAKAMPAVYADLRELSCGEDLAVRAAQESYAIADAMLRAREAA